MMDELDSDDLGLSDNPTTPISLKGTAEQRKMSQAGCRSLGLVEDANENDAVEEGKQESSASKIATTDGKQSVRSEGREDISDGTNMLKEMEFAEDEYFPHMGALEVEAPGGTDPSDKHSLFICCWYLKKSSFEWLVVSCRIWSSYAKKSTNLLRTTARNSEEARPFHHSQSGAGKFQIIRQPSGHWSFSQGKIQDRGLHGVELQWKKHRYEK